MTSTVSVRIFVADVAAAAAFYTGLLGFVQEVQTPGFAAVLRDGLKLMLSGPKSAAGKPLADGTVPAPGGWNRIMLTVTDVAAEIMRLKAAGVTFRGEPVSGPAGIIAVLDDPSGNPVELFQPAEH